MGWDYLCYGFARRWNQVLLLEIHGENWSRMIRVSIYSTHIYQQPLTTPFPFLQQSAACFFNAIPIQSQKAEPIVPSSCGLFFFRNSSMKRFAKSQQTSCKTANSLPTLPKTGWLSVSNLHCGEMDCLNPDQIVPRLVLLTLKMFITSVLLSNVQYSLNQLHPFRNGSNVCHVDPSAVLLTAATKINMHLMPGKDWQNKKKERSSLIGLLQSLGNIKTNDQPGL